MCLLQHLTLDIKRDRNFIFGIHTITNGTKADELVTVNMTFALKKAIMDFVTAEASVFYKNI